MKRPIMKLWIGHYLDAPHQWFVAWGETKMEAAAHVDLLWGEPDLRSMRRVEGPGAFNFRVEQEDGDKSPDGLVFLNADDYEEEVVMSLGQEEDVRDNARWIARCLAQPLGEPLVRRAGAAGSAFDITQEALLRVYTEDEPDGMPECECIFEHDLLNLPCEQYETSPATPGHCVVCEHPMGCHPMIGVRR